MNCLKCGRETLGDRSFCDDCLVEMEKYPVRPGTVVQLPQRRESAVQRKAPKRRTIPPEEQIKLLKKRLRIASIGFLVSAILALLLAYPAVQYLMEDRFAIGQNYSSVTTPSTSSGN